MEETIRGGKKYTKNTGYGGRRGRAGIGGQADRAGTQKEKKKNFRYVRSTSNIIS